MSCTYKIVKCPGMNKPTHYMNNIIQTVCGFMNKIQLKHFMMSLAVFSSWLRPFRLSVFLLFVSTALLM